MEQERPPDEIVISDDQSSDGTWEFVQDFARSASIPTLIRRSIRNVGYIANFEEAIKVATGDVIFLCDQDDIWDRRKLPVFEKVFLSNPAVGMVFSDAELIDESGRFVAQRAWERPVVGFTPQQRQSWLSGPTAAVERLMRGNVVTGATMAFRSRFVPLVLPVPGDTLTHDAWIALLVASVAPTVPIDEPYTFYRLHPGQSLGLLDPPDDLPRRHDEILTEHRRQLMLVAGRLQACSDRFPPYYDCLSIIEDKIDHLGKRLELTGSWLHRAPSVWREVRSGRYSRFSSGGRSAVSDLVPWVRNAAVGRGLRRR